MLKNFSDVSMAKAGDLNSEIAKLFLCWFVFAAVVVVRSYRVFRHQGFGVLVTTGPIRFEESVDRGIARFIHVEAALVLQPYDECCGDAFYIYLRSVGIIYIRKY